MFRKNDIAMDVILYIVLGVIILYLILRYDKGNHTRIPGPRGWPLVGYAPYMKKGDMHNVFTNLAKQYGDICKVVVFGKTLVALNSACLIREAFVGDKYKAYLNDRDKCFVGKYVTYDHAGIVFAPKAYGSDHGKLRKAFSKGMHAYGEGKQLFEDNVTLELIHLMERIQMLHGREFEMLAVLRRSLTNVMSIILGGHDLKDDDKDVNMFWEFDEMGDLFLGPDVDLVMMSFPFLRFIPGGYKREFERIEVAKQAIARRFIYEKKATYKPGVVRSFVDFFIGEQLEAHKAGRDVCFTDERIIAICLETIGAGILSSLGSLTSLLLCLINYPEYQAKIQAELDRVVGRERLPTFSDRRECVFTEAVILETLRYVPAVPLLIPHYCEEGIDFEGYQIPPKSLVVGNVWYVHHDEKMWGDPWKFRPERWLDDRGDLLPNDHILRQNLLPFGIGRRQCPGESLARSRIFLYVATLLQKWTFEMIPENAVPCDPRLGHFNISITIRPKPYMCRAVSRK